MYGLKRVEFNEDRTVKALEFHEDVSGEQIIMILHEFGFQYGSDITLIPPTIDLSSDSDAFEKWVTEKQAH